MGGSRVEQPRHEGDQRRGRRRDAPPQFARGERANVQIMLVRRGRLAMRAEGTVAFLRRVVGGDEGGAQHRRAGALHGRELGLGFARKRLAGRVGAPAQRELSYAFVRGQSETAKVGTAGEIEPDQRRADAPVSDTVREAAAPIEIDARRQRAVAPAYEVKRQRRNVARGGKQDVRIRRGDAPGVVAAAGRMNDGRGERARLCNHRTRQPRAQSPPELLDRHSNSVAAFLQGRKSVAGSSPFSCRDRSNSSRAWRRAARDNARSAPLC